ncbi:hypothetical protein BJX76DRAFT_67348 [Aspergillus varians]
MGANVPPPNWYQPDSKPNGTDPTSASRADQDQPNPGSPRAHEPEIYDIEDLPEDILGHWLGDKTVKPYAIEEPDEDATSESKAPSPPQQAKARYWEDLVDSMEELHCESDNNNPGLIFSKRGRKRKSTNSSNLPRSGQSCQSTAVPDPQYETSLGPKRPRQRDEHRKESQGNLKSARRRRFQKPRGSSGSSSTSESVSTDTSSSNLTNGTPIPDAMDLD